MRLELQSEKGDTQVIYDGHTLTLYDAADEHPLPLHAARSDEGGEAAAAGVRQAPPTKSRASREDRRSDRPARKHANVSGATPTDVAGQPAYTARVSPKEGGSLFGGAELSLDADNGVPLRAAHLLLDAAPRP